MRRTTTKLMVVSLLGISLLGFGSSARADVSAAIPLIGPGGTFPGAVLVAPPLGGILDMLGLPVGFYNSWVFDPDGIPGGGLVFAYQVMNTTGSPTFAAVPYHHVSNNDFGVPFPGQGFDTPPYAISTHHTPGISGLSGEFGPGGVAPAGHGLGFGGGLDWDFCGAVGGVCTLAGIPNSGGFSEVLWALTNAPAFAFGTIGVLDGGLAAAGTPVYNPTGTPVPEPSSWLLLGTGLLGLAGISGRKKSA